ncbi:MAG: hypothetical protein ABIK92_02730 [Pseudomonadota bacterium]
MKKHNKYTIIGLRALQRAAEKVAEDARKNNYKIPVWINGRIEYEIPGQITEQSVSADKDG